MGDDVYIAIAEYLIIRLRQLAAWASACPLFAMSAGLRMDNTYELFPL